MVDEFDPNKRYHEPQFGGQGANSPGPGGSGYLPAPSSGSEFPSFATRTGVNKMAIYSLIASLVGWVCCGFGEIVGLALGVYALTQIKQTGESGRGLAIAGISISAVMSVIMLMMAVTHHY